MLVRVPFGHIRAKRNAAVNRTNTKLAQSLLMSRDGDYSKGRDMMGKPIDADATDLWLVNRATDADVERVAQTCKQLHTLVLQGSTKITDAGLAHLSTMPQLQKLNIGGCEQVTDAGMQHISNLHQLDWLNLSVLDITDVGLRQLAGLTELESLNLECCDNITNAGLLHLAGLRKLRELKTDGSPHITKKGKAAFRAAQKNASASASAASSKAQQQQAATAAAAASAAAMTAQQLPVEQGEKVE